MATLIIVTNSEGVRRCNARHHEANEPDCDCVCEGRYHGRGAEQARDTLQDDVLAGRFGSQVAEATRETQGWSW